MGDFRKKILQTDFQGKKLLQGNTWVKKYPTLKKKVTPLYVREKSITRGLGKITFTQTKSPIPLSQVK